MATNTPQARPCELCGTAPEPAGQKVRRMLLNERIIAVCEIHAAEIDATPELDLTAVDAVEQAQRAFTEPGGQRSRLARRSPLDRRIFPPRPEGRRKSDGRRTGDR